MDPVVIDSGASHSYTNCNDDFIEEPTLLQNFNITGIGAHLPAKSKGKVRWITTDDHGNTITIVITAIYVPRLPVRLLSPQQLHLELPPKDSNTSSLSIGSTTSVLKWLNHSKTIVHDRNSKLPTFYIEPIVSSSLLATSTKQSNLDPHQQQLLDAHYRLGHPSMHLMINKPTQFGLPQRFSRVRVPICESCQLGKQTRTCNNKTHQRPIRGNPISPGDEVSIDQMECSLPGRYFNGPGHATSHSITVGTIFQDHASRFVYTHLQQSTNAQETLNAKFAFESLMHTYGIQIRHYRADAGAFASVSFVDKVKQSNQTINFSAPGYHQQNGIAERTIRTLTAKARTMLLHAASRWSSEIIQPNYGPTH